MADCGIGQIKSRKLSLPFSGRSVQSVYVVSIFLVLSMSPYLPLSIAIVAEVIATTALKSSEGFTRLVPTLVVIVGYGLAFYCLSLTLKHIPTGIAYAIWSGVGIVLISLVGWVVHKQVLDLPALIGLGLIIAGVVVINVFSKSIAG